MYEDFKLFVLYIDMYWIFCVYYLIYIVLFYICRYVLDLRVFLVVEVVFVLKMLYFKIVDNLNLLLYNVYFRNIVNLFLLFICKDERVEI